MQATEYKVNKSEEMEISKSVVGSSVFQMWSNTAGSVKYTTTTNDIATSGIL